MTAAAPAMGSPWPTSRGPTVIRPLRLWSCPTCKRPRGGGSRRRSFCTADRPTSDDRLDRSAEDLSGALLSHWQFGSTREKGKPKIRVLSPTVTNEGWASRHSDRAEAALYRALELLDLTLADPRLRQSGARLREIARAREVVVDFFVGPNHYGSTALSIQKYFDAFAVAARTVALASPTRATSDLPSD